VKHPSIEEEAMPTASSTTVQFRSGPETCRGTLLLPTAAEPVPGIVLCTGFAGTQDTPSLRAAAEAFTAAGFASLTFDYRRFGASDGSPRQVIRLADQRRDIHAAIDLLRSEAHIDSARIALWGTSLGGGHVIVVGSERHDIAAVIAQVPFNGFSSRPRERSRRASLRLLRAMVRDRLRTSLGLSPSYIRVVGMPESTSVMASLGAAAAVDGMSSTTWRNTVAPGVLFDMMRYRPGDAAGKLLAPLLVCIAVKDRESPEALVRQLADAAPRGRFIRYPVSHFDVYRPETRRQLLADQVAFLLEVT
jgi:pimeloyl-ACP methyl ester carboxylesterase